MNRSLKKLLTFEAANVLVAGKFSITGGAGAVNVITPLAGKAIKTIVRTGAGLYTITFKDVFPAGTFHTVKAWLALAALQTPGIHVRVTAFNPAAAGGATIGITVYQVPQATGTEGAIDPPAGSEVMFEVNLKNSALTAAG